MFMLSMVWPQVCTCSANFRFSCEKDQVRLHGEQSRKESVFVGSDIVESVQGEEYCSLWNW